MPVRPQVAINWCMRQGTVPIPGAKTLQQAEDNLGALGWRLTAGEVRPSPLPCSSRACAPGGPLRIDPLAVLKLPLTAERQRSRSRPSDPSALRASTARSPPAAVGCLGPIPV